VSGEVRVFVDEVGLTVPADARVIDAVRVRDPDAAAAVLAGTRILTDSRGLPQASDAPVYAGAIYRVVRARPAVESPAAGGDGTA
jgi:hypothetical protein